LDVSLGSTNYGKKLKDASTGFKLLHFIYLYIIHNKYSFVLGLNDTFDCAILKPIPMGLSDWIFQTATAPREPLKLDAATSPFAELYGGIAMDKQWDLHKITGGKSGNINHTKGTIKFGLWTSLPVQVLGTYDIPSGNFLWAWSAIHPLSSSDITEQALQLKAYGAKNGITMLTKDQFPAEKGHLILIGIIASGMLNTIGYHLVEKQDNITVVSLNGDKIKSAALSVPERVGAVVPELFSWFEMVDEKRAIVTYLTAKGYEVTWEGEEMEARLGGDLIKAKFDGERKLVEFR
jgi:hypothetical protein